MCHTLFYIISAQKIKVEDRGSTHEPKVSAYKTEGGPGGRWRAEERLSKVLRDDENSAELCVKVFSARLFRTGDDAMLRAIVISVPKVA